MNAKIKGILSVPEFLFDLLSTSDNTDDVSCSNIHLCVGMKTEPLFIINIGLINYLNNFDVLY